MYETGDKVAVQTMAYDGMAPISHFLAEKSFIIGDYVTYPDFFLFEQIELFDFVCDEGSLTKKHPNLEAYRRRVAGLPGLKEYLASDRCIKKYFNGKRAKINN